MNARRFRSCAAQALARIAVLVTFATAANALGPSPIDLALYGRLLETHTRSVPEVVGTRVDYAAIRESADWQRLVAQVHAARPSTLERDERLAFWINAYNILTIDLIRAHYPVDSIRDIGSFFFFTARVWDIEVATIEGRSISLGEIENEILRPMGDPRIHAAIVCASISCPPLARTPFRPNALDADLDAAMRTWLASQKKGIAIDRTHHVVRISRVFDWFEEDFEARGGVLPTIAEHVPQEDAAWLLKQGPDAAIRYFEYDWSLNGLE